MVQKFNLTIILWDKSCCKWWKNGSQPSLETGTNNGKWCTLKANIDLNYWPKLKISVCFTIRMNGAFIWHPSSQNPMKALGSRGWKRSKNGVEKVKKAITQRLFGLGFWNLQKSILHPQIRLNNTLPGILLKQKFSGGLKITVAHCQKMHLRRSGH